MEILISKKQIKIHKYDQHNFTNKQQLVCTYLREGNRKCVKCNTQAFIL